MNLAWKQRLFFVNAASLILSEGIYDLVFANMAFDVSGKAFTGAATYAVGYVAEILVSIFGSGFLDRYDRRRVFMSVLCLKFTLFLAAVAYGAMTTYSALAIMGFAFVIDLANHYSRLTTNSLVVSIFARDEIASVQGTGAIVSGLAKLAAPVLGAAVIVAVGRSPSLAVSAALQLGALGASLLLFRQFRSQEQPSTCATQVSKVKDSLLGTVRAARDMLSSRRWRSFVAVYTLSATVLGTATLEWLPFLRTYHGVTEGQTGLFAAAGALGMVGAGLLLRWLKDVPPSGSVLAVCMIAQAGALVLAASIHDRTAALVGILIFHVGLAYYFRTTAIILQKAIPVAAMGSWYGVIDALGRIFGLGGILVVGYLFDVVGGPTIYIALALLLVLTALPWLKGLHLGTSAECDD